MDEKELKALKDMMGGMVDNLKTDILTQTKEMIDAAGKLGGSKTGSGESGKGSSDDKTDVEKLAETIMGKMTEQSTTQNAQVFDTLYNEKVDELTKQYGAFGDYLNSKDDYGEVIGDKIKGINDYGKRIDTLGKVFKTFSQASTAGGDDNDLKFSKETKEKVKKHLEKRDEIKTKFLKGEASAEEFTNDFFATIGDQMAEIAQ